jgi:hypothetical protein
MKLYHLTHEDYVPSILSKGLIPGYSKGMKVNPEKPSNYVFLTDNIEHVLKQNMYRSGWIVLEVDIEGLDVKQHITRCFEPGKNIPIPNEFIFEGIIEPKRIKVNQELSSFKKPETQPRKESNMNKIETLLQKLHDLRVLRSSCEDSNGGEFRVHVPEKDFDEIMKLVGEMRVNRE